MSKTIREVKDELHKMFPQYRGFIEHTLVATMCNQYHLKQGQTLPIDSVIVPFYCNNDDESVRCKEQCLGCDGFERNE